MTIDEALLYDAEWCLLQFPYPNELAVNTTEILDIQDKWGMRHASSKTYLETCLYFNLLIREAVKC